MKEKELKRLTRAELLDLLLVQTRESERLRKRLELAEEKLEDRRIRVENAGSLAQAVVDINGVMEAAQAAAQQYLDNIAYVETVARENCEQMLTQTRQHCLQLLAEAEKEAARIRETGEADRENALLQEIYDLLDAE